MITVFLFFRKLFRHGYICQHFDVQILPLEILKNFEMNILCI
jgi:hypothetical protein